MSPITQQGFIPSADLNVTLSASTTPKITNLELTDANTEYSHALTTNLKQCIIKARGFAKLQISFTSGDSGTKFLTIPNGTSLSLNDLDFTGKTLYLQSDTSSVIVEILELY